MFFEKPSLSSGSLARGEAAGLGEVYDAAVESTRYVDNVNARVRGLEEAYDARIDGVEKATGVRLVNPYRSAVGSTAGAFGLDQETGDPHAFFQSELERLAENRPQVRDAIAPHRPVLDEAIKKARDKEQTLGDVMSRTPGWSKYGALFAGSFRAGLEDPANLGTMFLGPGGSVGQGAKAVLWMGVKAGAANAAVETSLQPFVQAWRAEAGLDYGLSTAALNIATAGALGFGLDAGIRGGYRAVQGLRGVKPVDALDAAARAAPEGSPLRRAADGDPAALNDLATAAGVADDPAMRGARMALETDIDSRIAGVEDGDHYDALINALRAADDPDAVPVKGADATPEARGPVLADDVPPPGARFEKDGKPVTFRSFTPEQLTADPAVFQFRRQVNSAGTTGRMAGIQVWDPMASGKAVVFQRRSGEYVIADGHHRLELAKRLADQKPELQGYLFREADGWTADDVRAYAAKKNMMDSPRVDPIDAASALRARPDLIDKSVAVGDETMRQARALARLSDEAFGMVVGGVLPPNYAALVGDLMPDKSRHASLVAELAGVEPANVREGRFALAEIMALPTTAETQATLFGAFRFERSLMKERMGVLDAALRSLKDDKKVFALLDREAGRIEAAGNKLDEAGNAARMEEAARLSGVIEQLAVTRGPVSDWLSDAARAVAAGMTKKQAADAFARRVASTLETDGLRGLMADEAPLRAGGFDEPLGPEAQAQIKGLEASLAREIEAATKPEKAAERQAALFDVNRAVHTPAAARQWGDIAKEIIATIPMLPRDVRLRVEENLVLGGQGADGMWDGFDRIVYVSLAAADPVRTVRHEAVHALRQSGLMSDSEFDTLYRFADKLGLRGAYDIDKLYKQNYSKLYGDQGEAYVEALLREETIANMFADYSVNGRRFGAFDGGGRIDQIIGEIVRFMKELRDKLLGYGFRHVTDIFEDIESGRMAQRSMRQVDLPGGAQMFGLHLAALRAFHGTPHTFAPEPGAPAGRFRMDRIGTGEGVQAYGHGLYFAENEDVARSYRDSLSAGLGVVARGRLRQFGGDIDKAIEYLRGRQSNGNDTAAVNGRQALQELEAAKVYAANSGRLYEVRIKAEPEDFLDWNLPFSQQSEKVQKGLQRFGITEKNVSDAQPIMQEPDGTWSIADKTGSKWSVGHATREHAEDLRARVLASRNWDWQDFLADKQTADMLRSSGIPGIRYLDQGSRGSGDGSRNYVVFDDSLVEIVAVDGRPVVNLGADLAAVERIGDAKDVVEACKA